MHFKTAVKLPIVIGLNIKHAAIKNIFAIDLKIVAVSKCEFSKANSAFQNAHSEP